MPVKAAPTAAPARPSSLIGVSTIRDGAYVAPGVICMPPMYVNIGAYVGEGSMIAVTYRVVHADPDLSGIRDAGLRELLAVAGIVMLRKNDHLGAGRVLPDVSQNLDPVADAKLDVQQDDVGDEFGCLVHGCVDVVGAVP